MTFLPLNCSAIAESIVESELFGHEKGSFTGADRRRRGCFELADKGTLFLDEVGDSSLTLQSKLLRVLETGEFQRVGGEGFVHVDVRVVAATNVDLEKAIQKKLFRQDLYYRLGGVKLNVPPLRRRREDILPLAEYFLRRVSSNESGDVPVISHEAAEILIKYSWPGNVRELANAIHQASTLVEGTTILPKHLPAHLIYSRWQHSGFKDFSDDPAKPPALKDIEKSAILSALRYCRGNVKEAASVIGISRATIHRKIKEYGINVSRSVSLIKTNESK
jgi:two-component system NtrC family response regulator